MALDDTLRRLAEKEASRERSAPQDEAPAVSANVTMEERASAIMGEALVAFLRGELPGQKMLRPEPAYLADHLPLVREKGIYLFDIVPTVEPERDVSAFGEIPEMFFLAIALNEEAWKAGLPPAELAGLGRLLATHMNWCEYDLTTLHPYLLMMGLAPEHRSLAALAVERALASGGMAVDSKALKKVRTSSGEKRAGILAGYVPAAQDIEAVAREYGRNQLPQMIQSLHDDYARIIASYAREAH